MALKDDIKSKVKAILDERFEVTDVTYVPKIDDPKLTFGNTGLKFMDNPEHAHPLFGQNPVI